VASIMIYKDSSRAAKITSHSVYRTLVALALACSIYVVEILSAPLGCLQPEDQDIATQGSFDDAETCLSRNHVALSVVAMIVLSLYVTVSQLLGVYFAKLTVEKDEGLDIRYSQSFLHVSTAIKLMLVLLEKALLKRPVPFLICAACLSLASAAYTAFFRRLSPDVRDGSLGPDGIEKEGNDMPRVHEAQGGALAACSVPWVVSLCVGVNMSTAFTAICCLVALSQPPLLDLWLPFFFCAGIAAIALSACVHGLMLKRRAAAQRAALHTASIGSVREELVRLAAAIKRQESLVSGFDKQGWAERVQEIRQPTTFAQHLLDLESATTWFVMNPAFLQQLTPWRQALGSLHVSLDDVEAFALVFRECLELGQEFVPRSRQERFCTPGELESSAGNDKTLLKEPAAALHRALAKATSKMT